MGVEQGKYGLWYSKGVGFATKEQAQAHEDGVSAPSFSTTPTPQPTPAPALKSPALWPGIIVAAIIAVSLVVLVTKWTRNYDNPERKAASDAAMQEIKMQRVVRGFVSKHLKDPASAEFRNQSGMCGEVNAKNGFGGYTGFRRFMAANENLVVFEGEKQLTPAEFDEAWKRAC